MIRDQLFDYGMILCHQSVDIQSIVNPANPANPPEPTKQIHINQPMHQYECAIGILNEFGSTAIAGASQSIPTDARTSSEV